MKDLENIILSFDIRKRVTESAAYPLMAYGVINYISSRELHEYLVDNGLKVSLSSIQNWRRNAAASLGLSPTGKGRQSYAQQKLEREEWHAKYGYPTIKQLVAGWSIHQVTKKEFRNESATNNATSESEIMPPRPTPTVSNHQDTIKSNESQNIQKPISEESGDSTKIHEISKFMTKTNKNTK